MACELARRHGVHRRTVKQTFASALCRRKSGRAEAGYVLALIDSWLVVDREVRRKQVAAAPGQPENSFPETREAILVPGPDDRHQVELEESVRDGAGVEGVWLLRPRRREAQG